MVVTEYMKASKQRLDFIDFILAQEGKPYLWAGKGYPDVDHASGFDCSGLVTAGLYKASSGLLDWRLYGNCNALFNKYGLKDTDNPQPGDLAFYGHGKNMVSHVMVWMGDGRVYGACGGDQDCTSIEYANKIGARVRYRGHSHTCSLCKTDAPCATKFEGAKYRKDFLNFKSLASIFGEK